MNNKLAKFVFVFACAISIGGCASSAFDRGKEGSLDHARAQLAELDINTQADSWEDLMSISAMATRYCLDIVIEEFDDGMSDATVIGDAAVPYCQPYFDVSEYIAFKGERILVDLRAARSSIAAGRVVECPISGSGLGNLRKNSGKPV